MIAVITENKVRNREAYLPLAKAFAADAANDRGCLGMEVYIKPGEPDKVVFLSRWESKKDFQAHVEGPSFSRHIPGMGAYYIAGTDTFLECV